jgi:hypothetical protein
VTRTREEPSHNKFTGEDVMTRVPTETLIRFVQGRCSPEEGLKILEQIESSPESSRELDMFADIIGVFHETPDLTANEVGADRPSARAVLPDRPPERRRRFVLRIVLPTASVLAAAIVFFFYFRPIAETDRMTLLEPDLSMVEWATRGAIGSDIDATREAAFRGNFVQARKHILRFVNSTSTDPERACGLITAGALSFLEARQKSKGWLHEVPDQELLRVGVGYLQEAAQLRVPPSIHNETRMLLARGLYWLGNRVEASAQLDSVAGGDPNDLRRAEELRSIISSSVER